MMGVRGSPAGGSFRYRECKNKRWSAIQETAVPISPKDLRRSDDPAAASAGCGCGGMRLRGRRARRSARDLDRSCHLISMATARRCPAHSAETPEPEPVMSLPPHQAGWGVLTGSWPAHNTLGTLTHRENHGGPVAGRFRPQPAPASDRQGAAGAAIPASVSTGAPQRGLRSSFDHDCCFQRLDPAREG